MQPTVPIEIPASSEAVVRQLPAYHEELQSPALSAPHGTVIEACEDTLTDPARCGCGGTDRLPTTLSDGSTDPATSLELPDHERREEEPAIDELKTHRRERPVLRSRTAAGAADRYVGDCALPFGGMPGDTVGTPEAVRVVGEGSRRRTASGAGRPSESTGGPQAGAGMVEEAGRTPCRTA